MFSFTKVIREYKNYKNETVIVVEKLDSTNKTYECEMSQEEFNIADKLRNFKNKLSSSDIDMLSKLIEEYGSSKYREGEE